eukprot:scaffold41175_cov33-Tisochrysis_lutea.AAC.5
MTRVADGHVLIALHPAAAVLVTAPHMDRPKSRAPTHQRASGPPDHSAIMHPPPSLGEHSRVTGRVVVVGGKWKWKCRAAARQQGWGRGQLEGKPIAGVRVRVARPRASTRGGRLGQAVDSPKPPARGQKAGAWVGCAGPLSRVSAME